MWILPKENNEGIGGYFVLKDPCHREFEVFLVGWDQGKISHSM